MKVSVVAAVRSRLGLLRDMLESLHATAEGPVDVVLRCDFDDAPMREFLCARSKERFIVGPRMGGYASLPAMANEAARLATGDFVLVVNDDAEFKTTGWDTKLTAAAAHYPDGLFVLGVDVQNAKNYVFPCVSRTHINLFGGVFDERVVYADIWTRDVYQPFGRAIRVPDVRIEHYWQGMSDDQKHAVRRIDQKGYDQAVYEGRERVRPILEGVAA